MDDYPFTDEEWYTMHTPPWDGVWDDGGYVCSRCHENPDGYFIYMTVLCHPGEEGYVEVTQAFCQNCYEYVAPILMELGFISHNHHATNLLSADGFLVSDSQRCGGYKRCTTPAAFGPELVQPRREF